MTIDQVEHSVTQSVRDFFDDPELVLRPGMTASEVDREQHIG